MKGKGVRNLQYELTTKTPLSYIVSSILRPKTLNGYKHMKGEGVRNLQHEYTAKTPLSYIVSNVERANVLFSFRFKQLHHIEICNACLNTTDVYNTVT